MYSVEKMGGANNARGAEFRGKTADRALIDVNEVPAGSTYYDYEAVELYVFDEDTKTWILQD
jgi:hypothetical protein